MLTRTKPDALELPLLLRCARVAADKDNDAAIRQILDEGIDWNLFAQRATDHGLAPLAGRTLIRVASDIVPEDILDALRAIVEQTRRTNLALFDELAGVIASLAKNGIEAIAFSGPILAIQAFGDLGLRPFGHLDFLVREPEMMAVAAALRDMGYQRRDSLTEAQVQTIRHLQGYDCVSKKPGEVNVCPHIRLTPLQMALDVDYPQLWRRAQHSLLNGRSMMTLAPEDNFIALAIQGGKMLWWKMKWASDVAGFIGANPTLDWAEITDRARAQGCLRVVRLAISLARKHFGAAVPDAMTAAELADPLIEAMAGRITARWQTNEPSPGYKTLSADRLRLHDGALRQARYAAKTLLLPGPHHVPLVALPSNLSLAYIPIKFAHDLVALPLWQGFQHALKQAERLQNALARFDLALAIMPASAETKLTIKRHQKSRADARHALAANPNDVAAWRRLGHALSGLKRYQQAIACYERALALEPENPTIWKTRRSAMEAIGKKADLSEFHDTPEDTSAWTVRAGAFWFKTRMAEAIEASDHALALDPHNIAAARIGIHSRLHSCDWRRREEDKRRVSAGLRAGEFIIRAMDHRGLCDSEEELRLSSQLVAREIPPSSRPLWDGEQYRHDKIRIAYLSTDLRVHAVASLIVGCFEHHDRTRFETTAISLGKNDKSEMRGRIARAFDRFIDARDMNDATAARLMRDLEIDIAIDLNGYTGHNRGVLARRPAPVQVNYLGFAGTMASPFMDYIIADRVIIPEELRRHYSEQVVYLPHTYLPNDGTRPIAKRIPSRVEAQLPETGFVFACFNQSYKFSPDVFGVWMRLLQRVEGSVLWLRSTTASAVSNLRREAKAQGISPERLVFAPPVAGGENHLARLRLADLFLDTLPYNAHATACDALWAGVPVVTCPGNAFPARVAASLLYAIGLPELVTRSLAEYEEVARTLACNPERLAEIKAKLMSNRNTEPLFDTARFTRDLESAYTEMWNRQQSGLPPASFAVESACSDNPSVVRC